MRRFSRVHTASERLVQACTRDRTVLLDWPAVAWWIAGIAELVLPSVQTETSDLQMTLSFAKRTSFTKLKSSTSKLLQQKTCCFSSRLLISCQPKQRVNAFTCLRRSKIQLTEWSFGKDHDYCRRTQFKSSVNLMLYHNVHCVFIGSTINTAPKFLTTHRHVGR